MNKFAGKAGRIFQVVAVLLFVTTGLKAQEQLPKESASAAQMRALNNSVLQIHGRMQQSDGGETAPIRNEAAMAIAQRSAALAKLIQEDPRAALSFAFSPELLADLTAKFPESTTQLESHTTLTGSIEHWVFDNAELRTSRESWFMNAAGQMLNLYFASSAPKEFSVGLTVTITGVRLGNEVAVWATNSGPRIGAVAPASASGLTVLRGISKIASDFRWPALGLLLFVLAVALASLRTAFRRARQRTEGLLKTLAVCGTGFVLLISSPFSTSAQSSTCSTTGAQNVAVLLVTFPGVTPPSNITQQSVHDMFFSTTGPSLDGFWREASYGQTSASGDVFGWYTLDSSYADCTRMDLVRDAAIAAAANSGVPIQTYNRIFVVTPDFGCGWTGLALGVCAGLNSPNGSFTASTSFLDASWQRSQIEGAENAAHEGGHNMGLAHAQSRTFGTEPLGPLGAAGTLTEYGDSFSDMAAGNSGHYAVPHKAEILNWISSGTNYQIVQSSGTWTLQPSEVNPAGLMALKVQRGTGNNSWIWVEYRQPIGIYESIWAPSGALIHYEDSTTGTHTQLLDFTPATTGMYDAALMPGTTWRDPYTNVSITVQSASASGLTVGVNYGATPCTSSSPSVVVSPLDPSIYPGQSASYSATVTNNDSSGCSSSTISLASNQPSGWSSSLSSPAVTLSPGQSTSVTLAKGAPNGTPPGTYPVNLNASTNSSSSSGTANATVMTPPMLAVNVSLSASTFSRPSSVAISATVTNGGTPASGASVAFTLIPPNGTTTAQTLTTGSNGVATWNYKLNSRSQVGIYSVSANAALSFGNRKSAITQTAGSNIVTFSVQ